MKKISLAVICIVFMGSAYAQYDEKALVILDAMSEKYQKISAYSAKIKSSMVNDIDGIDEQMNGEITVKGDMYRLKIDEQEIFNDGTTVWTYLSEVNEVNIDNYDPDEDEISPSKIYTTHKQGYKYLHLEEKNEGGQLCDVIDLIPENAKDAQFYKIKMFISQKDRSLVTWTMFERSGNKYKYTIEDFKANISVTDSHFQFDKDDFPGVEVVDLR